MTNLAYATQLQILKRTIKMSYIKAAWGLADLLGISGAILGIINNLDNIRSVILAFLLMVYLGIRIYYIIIEKEQKRREKEIDIWNKEQDKIERMSRWQRDQQRQQQL